MRPPERAVRVEDVLFRTNAGTSGNKGEQGRWKFRIRKEEGSRDGHKIVSDGAEDLVVLFRIKQAGIGKPIRWLRDTDVKERRLKDSES